MQTIKSSKIPEIYYGFLESNIRFLRKKKSKASQTYFANHKNLRAMQLCQWQNHKCGASLNESIFCSDAPRLVPPTTSYKKYVQFSVVIFKCIRGAQSTLYNMLIAWFFDVRMPTFTKIMAHTGTRIFNLLFKYTLRIWICATMMRGSENKKADKYRVSWKLMMLWFSVVFHWTQYSTSYELKLINTIWIQCN